MSDAAYLRLELDKAESAVDTIVNASKQIEEAISDIQGVLALLGVSTGGTEADSMFKLSETMKIGNDVQINNAFSLRQLIWAFRPKL
jgi:hypothetical protein